MRLIENNLKNFCLLLVVAFCAVVGCDSQPRYSIRDKDDFDQVLALAEQGDVKAMNSIGDAYTTTFRPAVPPNEVEALKWYRKAADLGDAAGQLAVGHFYLSGDAGLPKDEAEGVKWIRKAAEQGHGGAQNTLGLAYAFGWGMPVNDVEAYAWVFTSKANGYDADQEGFTETFRLSPEEKIAAEKRAAELFSKYPSKN